MSILSTFNIVHLHGDDDKNLTKFCLDSWKDYNNNKLPKFFKR